MSLARLRVAAALLAACALAPAVSQPTATDVAAVRTPRAPPRWELVIEAPEPFGERLRQHLDIGRFQSSDAGTQAEPASGLAAQPVSRSELRRLVAAVPEQARSMLDAEGYFSARIEVSVSEEVGDAPMTVTVRVEPGAPTLVTERDMQFAGDLDVRLQAHQREAQTLVSALDAQWRLPVGAVFTQSAWVEARSAALATLRAEGYPTAAWAGTAVTVDAAAHQARLFTVADSGPLFHFGPVSVKGLRRQPESAILNAMPFRTGQPYTEQRLLDFEARLQALNLFDSVFVSMSQDPEASAAAPIDVSVRELPLQQATAGVGASSDTGPRVSLEHQHRLVAGWPAQLHTRVQWGRQDSLLQSDLLTHPLEGGSRWFASGTLQRQKGVDSATTESQRVKAGVGQEGNRLERSTYGEYQQARVLSEADALVSQASAVQVTQQFIWRDVDSRTLPTRGVVALVQASGGRSFSTLSGDGVYSRFLGKVQGYRPLGGHWYASTRAEAGYVLTRDGVVLPDTLLFRAGGDESVRGYRFGSLGVNSQGVTLGGRAMATGSMELARPLMESRPSLWGAVFVDAGDAAQRWTSWSPKLGYGVGLRIRTPLGPIKLDVAHGQQAGGIRLHFNVGLSL